MVGFFYDTDLDALPMLMPRAALLDADSRVLLHRPDAAELWDLPGTACAPGDDPLAALVAMLARDWQVTTFARAFFPLSFAVNDSDRAVTLSYGCRNWVGANGLQRVADDGIETMWLRPVRMGDYALAPACRMMLPVWMQLLEQGSP